ncbi:unnamed protein product [Spodoptera littoralis]|uniref:Lipase domain-containing protein n=1 Tax=Spodoptera littoralis TaxID=7109 RepID=A0A9P0I4C7_SPOLI|nr:unnamed protein product [Spodoptera littoralis]CAH1639586.1 unnamed protein product [Spodoptera littoralis]
MAALVKLLIVLCTAVAASGHGLGPTDVEFHLFHRGSPTVSEPLLPTQNSLLQSSISILRPTVITIHNYGEKVFGNFNAFVVPAHLFAEDVNLIAVGWSAGSELYSQGLANAVECGERIAYFIDFLAGLANYGPENYRIVGVGLGGHIAGIAASHVHWGRIRHIVAIDPSLIGWTHNPHILSADKATVVEVLHGTAGVLGYDYPLGDLDFYPNGGTYQTGCGIDISCSHILSYAFYAESLTAVGGSQFVATACESYEEAVAQTCSGDKGVVFGGIGDKTGQSGIYSFQTNFVPPFAQG